jgi:diguanylate cyclase (GGDEF)-like protein
MAGLTMKKFIKDEKRMKAAVALAAAVFIPAAAAVDYLTRHQTPISLFYALAIVATAWFSWPAASAGAAMLSGICMAAVTAAFAGPHTSATATSMPAQSAFFLAFAAILMAFKYLQDQLGRMSTIDPLTELVNSRHFLAIGSVEIERSQRYKHPFSIIYIDIDDFKDINETVGHGAGNELLREIARTIKAMIRRTDTVARLGGDDFALLMPETGESAVKAVVARIQAKAADIKAPHAKKVTFSFGVITAAGHGGAFDEMVRMAHTLMREAKGHGKNTAKYSLVKKS